MKKITLFISLIISIYAFSVNIVSNGTFENTTFNYGWTNVGSQTVAAETTTPLSGSKSYKATLSGGSGLANTIYSWTPIALAKSATYKITFKAKATNAASLTVLITNVTALTGNSITNQTVSLTSTVQSFELTFTNTNICGYNIFHFLYGNFPSGTVITLDDVSIQETTSPLTNGNLCLGDFETTMVTGTTKTPNPAGYSSYGASGTGWTYLKPSGGTFLEGISATNPISGTKSANLSISGTGAPGATNISHMYVWSFNAALGNKFTCTFKAKVNTGTFNAGIKFASYDLTTTNFENITGVALTTTTQTFTFTSNTIGTYSAYYLLCLEIGTLPIGSVITLDDVELYQSEVETPTAVSPGTISSTGFTASWNAIPRAESYDVSVYQGPTLIGTTNASGQATTSLAIAGLSGNTTYTYTVLAKGNGTSTFDSAASAPITFSTTTTSLSKIENGVKCYSISDGIKVDGLNTNDNVLIYSVSGTLIDKQKALNSTLSFNLSKGIYLVRVANVINKVIVQ